jgi:hypothetical protein
MLGVSEGFEVRALRGVDERDVTWPDVDFLTTPLTAGGMV